MNIFTKNTVEMVRIERKNERGHACKMWWKLKKVESERDKGIPRHR